MTQGTIVEDVDELHLVQRQSIEPQAISDPESLPVSGTAAASVPNALRVITDTLVPRAPSFGLNINSPVQNNQLSGVE